MVKISIVVCSRFQELDDKFLQNITDSIGVEYEVLPFINQNSIFSAYNKGISMSSGDIICFLHEDIRMHTANWGKILERLFNENPSIGLLGIAGAMAKTKIPSGWWDCDKENKAINIIQHFPDKKKEHQCFGFKDDLNLQAVSIDGVFMALRRKAGARFWDELNGFHGYDLSLSFEVLKRNYKIGITRSILIEHYSYGHQSADWLEAIIKAHQNYSTVFPLNANNSHELKNCRLLLDRCLLNKKMKWFYYYWLKLIRLKPISRLPIYYLRKALKN